MRITTRPAVCGDGGPKPRPPPRSYGGKNAGDCAIARSARRPSSASGPVSIHGSFQPASQPSRMRHSSVAAEARLARIRSRNRTRHAPESALVVARASNPIERVSARSRAASAKSQLLSSVRRARAPRTAQIRWNDESPCAIEDHQQSLGEARIEEDWAVADAGAMAQIYAPASRTRRAVFMTKSCLRYGASIPTATNNICELWFFSYGVGLPSCGSGSARRLGMLCREISTLATCLLAWRCGLGDSTPGVGRRPASWATLASTTPGFVCARECCRRSSVEMESTD